MAQADRLNTRADAVPQTRMSGFVLTEDGEFILRNLFAAMDATAFAYDLDDGGATNLNLTGDQVAAIIRAWASLGKMAMANLPFADSALARSSGVH